MKRIKNIILLVAAGVVMNACERDLDSEGITTGLIRFPAVSLKGDQWISFVAGEDTYAESGVVATLGTDDITDDVQVSGAVDSSTPGVYVLNYSVSIENEIGEQSSVSVTRYVAVVSDDATAVDLSGTYRGNKATSRPVIDAVVTKLDNGFYNITDVLSTDLEISVDFAYIGDDKIVIPPQNTPYGVVNSVGEATLTADGFKWTASLGCCGSFNITFVKQ